MSIETQEKYSTTLINENKSENGDVLNSPYLEKYADRYTTSVVHEISKERYDSTVVHDQTPKGFPKEKVSYRDYYNANIPKELVPTNKPKRLKDKAAKLAAENAASQAATQVANSLQENESTPSPIKSPQLSQTGSVRIHNIIVEEEEKEKIERFDSDDDDGDTPIYSPTTSNTTHNVQSTDKTTSTPSSTNGNIASVSNRVTETDPLLPSSNNNANINNTNTNITTKSNWCCSF